MMDFDSVPGWVDWILAMAGARALGFAYGMFRAARDPSPHIEWIRAMIGSQAIDWVATLACLIAGTVEFAQVTSAAFLPVVFIIVLVRTMPRTA